VAGIVGILGQNSQQERAERMLQTITHRGSDEAASLQVGQVALAVGAPSLSAARGSGLARDGDVAIAFDGEIYNERADGVSDADVALDLYRTHGRVFAGHLQGVFACAVCDGDELLLARDTVGVRPLYWGTTPQGDIAFASAAARRSTNCILSGEGGDELFGGYHLLKDLPTEAERLRMMGRLIEVAYNTAVQRLDRAMFGNGITYRTPFIDTEVIALALQLPVSWKIHGNGGGEPVEKFILREVFKDLLPEAIYRRRKLRFSAGTGTDGLMDRIAEGHVSRQEFEQADNPTPQGYVLNSPKELWYYRLFKQRFPAPCFERLVGRWDPGK